MRLGCHAVLFREKIKTDTENIIKGLSETGFEGSEIGSRFFGTEEKGLLLQILKKYNYQMSGMHVGVPLKDWANKEKREEQKKNVLKVAEFVQDMPNKNVIMSGSDLEDGFDLKIIAEAIEEVAQGCLKLGVRLHYHNHAWEFKDNAKIFKALVEYAPSLYFALDLGWVYAGGFDPIKIVEEHKDRISYVHLRDANENKEFVNLGEGIFDYSKLMEVLKEVLGKDGWAVVEYEEGEQSFERYGKAKVFLDGLV